MLGGDERRIAMTQALLMSLPGAPVLRYGDEIGMGEDLTRSEREAVRTPMQWSDAENAGFSRAPENRLAAPVISGGRFGYERLNVYAQTLGQDSLLAKVGNIVRTRAGAKEVGRGRCEVVDVGCAAVLALRYAGDGVALLTVVNLSAEEQTFQIPDLDLSDFVDILADGGYPSPGDDPAKLSLQGYGYRWLRRREDLSR